MKKLRKKTSGIFLLEVTSSLRHQRATYSDVTRFIQYLSFNPTIAFIADCDHKTIYFLPLPRHHQNASISFLLQKKFSIKKSPEPNYH